LLCFEHKNAKLRSLFVSVLIKMMAYSEGYVGYTALGMGYQVEPSS
jgi:hypothetical protein